MSWKGPTLVPVPFIFIVIAVVVVVCCACVYDQDQLQADSVQQPRKPARQGKLKAGRKRKRSEGERAEYGVTRGVDFRGVKTVINVDAPATVQR